MTRSRRRGTAARYGARHQRARAAWQRRIDRGERVLCRRAACGTCLEDDPQILIGEDWRLGHPDVECDAPTAPEHVRCNQATSPRFAGRHKHPVPRHPGLLP